MTESEKLGLFLVIVGLGLLAGKLHRSVLEKQGSQPS